MRDKKYNIEELSVYRLEWALPCTEAVPEEKRELYLNRVRAVDAYINGLTLGEIERLTKIPASRITGLIEKCLEEDMSGKQYGYAGLLPGKRFKDYERGTGSNSNAGLFGRLLSDHPELCDYIEGNYRGDKRYTLEHVIAPSALYKKFLLKCREYGLGPDDYPFNTKDMAERSFRKFLADMESRKLCVASSRMSEDARSTMNGTGIGKRYERNAVVPYACVQVDGHIIDIIYTTEVALDDGTYTYMECQRCWLFAVIDVATRCILGYSLSQEYNYNQFDVLRGIRNSILPHKRAETDSLKTAFPENGGFPSTAYEECRYAMPDRIMLDNARSHLAQKVMDKLSSELKCTMDYGAVSAPETRGIIERFFGTLESRGFHRLPSTTGSSSRDIRRKDPERNAGKYQITFDDICVLMEALIAEYNNTPHSALLNLTPMEEMGRKLENGMLPYIANDAEREEATHLTDFTKTVTVCSDIKRGRRPYICFMGARYRNDALACSYEHAGKSITIRIDPSDISSVTGYLDDGTCIGELTAAGEYGRHPHSLKSRMLMNRLAGANNKKQYDIQTPVSDFEVTMRKRASASKKARTRLDILKREMDKDGDITDRTDDKTLISVPVSNGVQNTIGTEGVISREEIFSLSSEELWKMIEGGAANG